VLHGMEDEMDHSFAFSVLIGMALYAAIGLFGFVIVHGPDLFTLGLTDGYGVAPIAKTISKTAVN
jgi:hypothetical protein